MPVVRKRPREDGSKTNEQVKRRKRCKEYTEFENIGYQDDHWHSTFRSLPENIIEVTRVLSRYIGSFLNGDGGILCFGVRKTGVIYGDEINRREEDNIKLIIDEIFKKMTPHIQTDAYRVTFSPVLGHSYHRVDGVKQATQLQVLEIRVAPGDPFSLYEDQNHEVFLRKGSQPYGPLTPHEIKRHTVQQLTRQLKSHKDFAKLFEKTSSKEKDKENSIITKDKSSSVRLSPTKKSSFNSNRSSPSKTSKSLIKVSLAKSSKLASCKTSLPKVQVGTKECPIVLSSGESDHEAPLPSVESQTKSSESKKNTAESDSMGKPQATKLQIKPFQIKKKVQEPTITQAKCQEKLQDKENTSTQKKASVPPTAKQPTKQTNKLLPLMSDNQVLIIQKQISSNHPKPSSRSVHASVRPVLPPPPPPPSFSHTAYLHAHDRHHYTQPPPHPYHSHTSEGCYSQYDYPTAPSYSTRSCTHSRYGYPSYPAHPLAKSYSAPYYH